MIGPNTTTCEGASHHELRLKLKWLPCIIRRLKGTAKRARKFASKGGDGPVFKGKGVDDSGVVECHLQGIEAKKVSALHGGDCSCGRCMREDSACLT